jgi:predicted nucleic acid-binding Zn ribbon protein
MSVRPCICCGRNIPQDRDRRAHTCSQACSDEAARLTRRRHERRRRNKPGRRKRRSREYLSRRSRRQAQRAREKRQADPAWQAWRSAVEERKRRSQEAAQQRTQKRAQRYQEEIDRLEAALSRQALWNESRKPEYKRARWRWQRRRKEKANPKLYHKLKKERQKRRNAPLKALRELGWIDVVKTIKVQTKQDHWSENPKICRLRYELRKHGRDGRLLSGSRVAYPGQVIVIDRAGRATFEPSKKLAGRRRYWRTKLARAALKEMGLIPERASTAQRTRDIQANPQSGGV